MKKSLIEKILKDKRLFWGFLGTLVFVIIGFTCFIAGAYLTGRHVLEWFISDTALVIYYIVLAIVIPIVICILILKFCLGDNANGRK